MVDERDVRVSLLPDLAKAERLAGSVAVVIDVLRATTSIVHAFAAGCATIHPCESVDAAQQLAGFLSAAKVKLAGERGGLPIEGFDFGNSPKQFTGRVCKGTALVLTTTNGTRAILRAAPAARTLIAAFANFSAVCEQLRHDKRPISILCAGNDGDAALEDTLLAGALVEFLRDQGPIRLNDGARLAWDCFETHGQCLKAALALSEGGQELQRLGFEADIAAAANVDEFALVPELRLDPVRLEIGAAGIVKSHWQR